MKWIRIDEETYVVQDAIVGVGYADVADFAAYYPTVYLRGGHKLVAADFPTGEGGRTKALENLRIRLNGAPYR